ncbi:hypothetical protein C900_01281 [Fulvivirga imtechensis AK7]|uniref:Uncharacterized protein n=1 Tax=Fulvivirga imtechensis AK7 TaxID=1237149 RepID=L8JGJ9_9BACT|nr:hypothetical protein C900_01281 [Fulvivirga imtechensis AK7]
MSVLYNYYYLFYSKILKDNEPHMYTIMALSASEAFVLIGIVEILMINFYCYSIGKWVMLGIVAFCIGANYFIFHKTGKAKEIIRNNPKFFNNHKLSIVLTIAFFLITLSFIFWGPIYTKYLLNQCR